MQTALGVGSLVLMAGGVTALVRRALRPGQALGVVAIAVVVGLIAAFAHALGGRMGAVYEAAIVVSTTIAGIVMAVVVVTTPPRRIP